MKIYLNNSSHPIEKETTVASFLEKLNINFAKGIAIAINNTVISKSEWEKTFLKDEDKITLIKASAGG